MRDRDRPRGRTAGHEAAQWDGIELDLEDIIGDTWRELEGRLEMVGERVFVRSRIPRRVLESGIILPPKASSFYYGLPNIGVIGKETAMKWVTVLCVGPDAHVLKPLDQVWIPRGWFAPYKKLKDGSYTGWIHETNIWLQRIHDDTKQQEAPVGGADLDSSAAVPA